MLLVEVRSALKNQYHASLKMMKQMISVCPDDLWTKGENHRPYWRIAYHALYYTHWYLHQKSDDFCPWKYHVENIASLWQAPDDDTVYSKKQLLGYLKAIALEVEARIDTLDLDAETTGFAWYPGQSKFEHQLVNLRHIHQHIGQLSELLMANGIETRWVGQHKSKSD